MSLEALEGGTLKAQGQQDDVYVTDAKLKVTVKLHEETKECTFFIKPGAAEKIDVPRCRCY